MTTIGPRDPSGYHLISGGYNLLRILRNVPTVRPAEAGAAVRHDYVEEAAETLRAAGHIVSTPTSRAEWTEVDQVRSHNGWRLATRALGNDPDVIERQWAENGERPRVRLHRV